MDNIKKHTLKRLLITCAIQYAVAVLVTFLTMAYQNNYELYGLINGLQVAGAFIFITGWFVFINHHGVFDVITYSVQSFFKSFTKEPKMKKTLLEKRLERKQLPKYLFLSMWINGIMIIIISYIIYEMLFIPFDPVTPLPAVVILSLKDIFI